MNWTLPQLDSFRLKYWYATLYLTSVVLVLLYLHTGIYTRTYMASDGRGPTDLASETECVTRTGTSQYGTPGTMQRQDRLGAT